ncbi:leucine-rich repeat domain-containing protein [Paenibacillus sp. GYB003]|uniref:leucine-rich repeat domain-containing protein n=1 Tax=Paenibacillus sp. GYB003 TaxID=2994392 RepID=UPI003FA6C2B9
MDLSHNAISDFSSVLDLPLYSLTLRYNRLSDLSFIARDRWHLDYLDVRHNQIEDISPFVHLVNLSKLFVGHNPVTDFSVLDQLSVQQHDVASYKPRRKRG